MANRQTFTIAESPAAFKVLSSNLYSNPVLAVIRELTTNAYDAQVMADTNDEHQIELHLPTGLDNQFRVRDWGNGLSEDEVFTIYTQFFSSTKSESEDQVGTFGLGSKSPFALTDIYHVNSYQNGQVKKYLMSSESGYPVVTLEKTADTDEHDGLEIIIDFDESRNAKEVYPSTWQSTAAELFKTTAFLPDANFSDLDVILEGRERLTTENVTFYTVPDAYHPHDPDFKINVAGVGFDIDQKYFYPGYERSYGMRTVYQALEELGISSVNIMAGKFDVTLTPSREQLHYDDKTINFVKSEVERVICEKFEKLDPKSISDLMKLFHAAKSEVRYIDENGRIQKAIKTKLSGFCGQFGKSMVLPRSIIGVAYTKITKFPFSINFREPKELVNFLNASSKKIIYHINMKNATSAQKKAFAKMECEPCLKNNLINCLASHFDTVKDIDSRAIAYYVFDECDNLPEGVSVVDVDISKYENYFKRYKEDKSEKPEVKAHTPGGFLTSATIIVYNGKTAKVEYYNEHEDMKAKKLLKVVSSGSVDRNYAVDRLRSFTKALGEEYVVAYRRGSEVWQKNLIEAGEATELKVFLNSYKTIEPKKYQEAIKTLHTYELIKNSKLWKVYNSLDQLRSYLDMDLLNKVDSWKLMTSEEGKKATKICSGWSNPYTSIIRTYSEYELSAEEKANIDKEIDGFEFIEVIDFYAASRSPKLAKVIANVINNGTAEYLESVAA